MTTSVLERQGSVSSQDAIRVKYTHLNAENIKLLQRIKELQTHNLSLKNYNQQLRAQSSLPSDALLKQLEDQNQHLEQTVQRLNKANQQLACDVLMKSQLICQNQNQFKEILSSYEEKILELRGKLQTNERMVAQLQEQVSSDKDQGCIFPNRLNLLCFNEMNELKVLVGRLNLENAQLKAAVSRKDEELASVKNQLFCCEKALKDRDDWMTYRRSLCDSTKKKDILAANALLDEQATRINDKSKASISKLVTAPTETMKLKAIITKYAFENGCLKSEVNKLQRNLETQGKQHKLLQQACLKLETAMRNNKVEIEFYRNNFRELTKVTSERKIHYYENEYDEEPVQLTRQIHEKENLISYWQNWSKLHPLFGHKIALKTGKKLRRGRSKSCPLKMRQLYVHPSQKNWICHNKQKEFSIPSFIEEPNSINNPQLAGQLNPPNSPNDMNSSFPDAFSIIAKPDTFTKHAPDNKQHFVELDLELDD